MTNIDAIADEIRDIVDEIRQKSSDGETVQIEELSIEADFLGPDDPDGFIENDGEDKVLVLNLSKFEIEAVEDYIWSGNGFLSPDINEDVNLALDLLENEELNEIVGYVDQYLTETDVDMIRNCLYIRQDWEDPSHYTSKKELSDRRYELSNRFNGREVATISNFCSAGYYDPNGYMRKLFENPDEMSEFENNKQQRIHNHAVARNPFAVFVSDRYGVGGTKSSITDSIDDYDNHKIKVEFVDARAQGKDNRNTLECAMIKIHKEYDLLRYDVQVTKRETAYRISCEEAIPHEE